MEGAMKRWAGRIAGAALGLALTGCGNVEEEFAVDVEEMANLAAANKADCGKMTKALDEFYKNRPTRLLRGTAFGDFTEKWNDLSDAEKVRKFRDHFKTAYAARMKPAATKIRPGLRTCGSNSLSASKGLNEVIKIVLLF
jgi:hypothetical protein